MTDDAFFRGGHPGSQSLRRSEETAEVGEVRRVAVDLVDHLGETHAGVEIALLSGPHRHAELSSV